MNDQEPAPEGGRACHHCGGPIPPEKRADAKYCSKTCHSTGSHKVWRFIRAEEWNNRTRSASQKHRDTDKRHAEYRGVDLLGVRKAMLNGARARAKKKGLLFNLTLDDVQIPSVCPVLGIPIEVGRGFFGDGSPSLDKIVPALGYTKNNVEVISWRANSLKSNATVPEMEALYRYYSNKISKEWMVPNGKP